MADRDFNHFVNDPNESYNEADDFSSLVLIQCSFEISKLSSVGVEIFIIKKAV